MKCWRLDLRRHLSSYVHGEMAADAVKRLEAHLLDCGECRTRLSRIQSGHRLAGQLPRFEARRDDWPAIEAAIEGQRLGALKPAITAPPDADREAWLKPAFAVVVAALAIAVVLLVTSGRHTSEERRNLMTEAIDLAEFHPVRIDGFENASKPHLVAEGYVSEVRVNDEDGDLSFKLVENLESPGPFIICEIIDPIKLRPPSVGSRVRVYGVSRYDGQVDHNWYELHPVLNIQLVRD